MPTAEEQALTEAAHVFRTVCAQQNIKLADYAPEAQQAMFTEWLNNSEPETPMDFNQETVLAFAQACAEAGRDPTEISDEAAAQWCAEYEEEATKVAAAQEEYYQMGRVMAHGFAEESQKIANAAGEAAGAASKGIGQKAKELWEAAKPRMKMETTRATLGGPGPYTDRAKFYGKTLLGLGDKPELTKGLTSDLRKELGIAGAGATGLAGAAYGGKKLYDRHQANKNASFNDLVDEAAQEIIFEAAVQERVAQLLGR